MAAYTAGSAIPTTKSDDLPFFFSVRLFFQERAREDG